MLCRKREILIKTSFASKEKESKFLRSWFTCRNFGCTLRKDGRRTCNDHGHKDREGLGAQSAAAAGIKSYVSSRRSTRFRSDCSRIQETVLFRCESRSIEDRADRPSWMEPSERIQMNGHYPRSFARAHYQRKRARFFFRPI